MRLRRRDFLFTIPGAALAASNKWIDLSRVNWKPAGNAVWSIGDGVIVGRQGTAASPGDFFTEQQWADFELQCEWKMRWPGNSGIWFRYTGPNSAYQADILDEPMAYPDALSGSLYCMGKAFIAKNSDHASIHPDGLNRLHIQAVGDHIVIVQNGKKVVDVHDSTFAGPGSIGIQVHPGKQFEDMEVRVRDLRLRPIEKKNASHESP